MENGEVKRIYASLDRIEDRQDGVIRDVAAAHLQLGNRIDRVGERIEDARAESARQYVALNGAFTQYQRDIEDRLDDFDAAILKLGVKTGAELGKVRASSDAVATAQRRWRAVVSGDVLVRYRVIVLVFLVVMGLVYGWGFVQFIGKLLSINL